MAAVEGKGGGDRESGKAGGGVREKRRDRREEGSDGLRALGLRRWNWSLGQSVGEGKWPEAWLRLGLSFFFIKNPFLLLNE